MIKVIKCFIPRSTNKYNKRQKQNTYLKHSAVIMSFLIKVKKKIKISTMIILNQYHFQVLAKAIRQDKKKGIQIRNKKVKCSFFVEDTILYAEALNMTHIYTHEHTEIHGHTKLLELINTFRQVIGQKINIQKSVCFYVLTRNIQKKNEQINCNIIKIK